jgi:hypothetical protein
MNHHSWLCVRNEALVVEVIRQDSSVCRHHRCRSSSLSSHALPPARSEIRQFRRLCRGHAALVCVCLCVCVYVCVCACVRVHIVPGTQPNRLCCHSPGSTSQQTASSSSRRLAHTSEQVTRGWGRNIVAGEVCAACPQCAHMSAASQETSSVYGSGVYWVVMRRASKSPWSQSATSEPQLPSGVHGL